MNVPYPGIPNPGIPDPGIPDLKLPDLEIPDHRRLGRQLGIFATDEACGAGLPLWLPAGAVVRAEIERFIVDLERVYGYQHVYTPEMAKRQLYERSGHWDHYHDDMYPPMQIGPEQVVLRPMNCPHHILVYASEPRTIREMPFRLAELGTMFRYERSGVVGGLSRVRQMTLNDGHVFCAPEHVRPEIASILELVDQAYEALALPAPKLRLSRRGDGPKYAADVSAWERSEELVRSVLGDLGLDFTEAKGEAAFYGPKIDLQVADPQGREETLSTIQLDFHLPERFELTFKRGANEERPVIVHRSIVSTMERVVAHLLEVHNGALPVWLAPAQVVIMPVTSAAVAYSRQVQQAFLTAGLRAEVDDRDATLGARVRDAQQRRAPYVAVVGPQEMDNGTVAVRLRSAERLPSMTVEHFVKLVSAVVARRGAGLLAEP
jgi:threonyl-tRNA synthetase